MDIPHRDHSSLPPPPPTGSRPLRGPRAGRDPIDDAVTAVRVLADARADPPRFETIAILLDDRRCGHCIVVVDGTDPPDRVLDVVELLAEVGAGAGAHWLLLASVRPDGSIEPDDLDRWLEMNALADDAGLRILDWFVMGRDLTCPRDLFGEPPRWSCRR